VDQRFTNENLVVELNHARNPPFVRYGQVTSNPAEQFFSAMRARLDLPLVPLMEFIIGKTTTWHLEQKRDAEQRVLDAASQPQQMRLKLVPHVVEAVEALLLKTTHYRVVYQVATTTQLRASVQNNERDHERADVVIDLLPAAAVLQCTCGMVKELERPCVHVVSAVKFVPQKVVSRWSFLDLRMYGRVWHTSTWAAQFNAVPVALSNLKELLQDRSIRLWQRVVKAWV
jgi:hypothetical protein